MLTLSLQVRICGPKYGVLEHGNIIDSEDLDGEERNQGRQKSRLPSYRTDALWPSYCQGYQVASSSPGIWRVISGSRRLLVYQLAQERRILSIFAQNPITSVSCKLKSRYEFKHAEETWSYLWAAPPLRQIHRQRRE
jgi:hypothetical protein